MQLKYPKRDLKEIVQFSNQDLVKKHVPSKSEIELQRKQSYISSTDDDDYDSVIFDRESSC